MYNGVCLYTDADTETPIFASVEEGFAHMEQLAMAKITNESLLIAQNKADDTRSLFF